MSLQKNICEIARHVPDIVVPVADLADSEAKIFWERRYPDVLCAYYSAVAAVAAGARSCSGGAAVRGVGFADDAGLSVGAPLEGVGAVCSGSGCDEFARTSGGCLPLGRSGTACCSGDRAAACCVNKCGGLVGVTVGEAESRDIDVSGRCGNDNGVDVKCEEQSGEVKPAGRWRESNRRKRVKRAEKKRVPEWRRAARPVGFCETVLTQSSCPSYGQAVSDAEREAKESLAKRRAAENALQEKLAKMKLADLEDEQKCQEYAQLKRQRVIQWTNEATAKSQQSLDKCKSIDPGSSSSQFEIRKTAKELEDLKLQHAHLIRVFHDAVPDAAKIIAMTKLPGTESMERYQLEGEFIGGWGDDHSISS